MTATLTAFSPVDHPRELLQALRRDYNQTVHFHCYDGDFSSSVLLLAAVSPLIQEIGRQQQISLCDCEEIDLIINDYSVNEIQQFMNCLTSYSGPATNMERETFSQLLGFFGQQLTIEESLIEEVMKNEASAPEEHSTDSEVEEDWHAEYQSSDFDETESVPRKRPNFKSKFF